MFRSMLWTMPSFYTRFVPNSMFVARQFLPASFHMITYSGFYFFLQAMVMATFEKEALPQTVAVAYQKNVSQAPPCQPTWRIAGKLEAFSRDCSSLKPPLKEHLVQTVGVR